MDSETPAISSGVHGRAFLDAFYEYSLLQLAHPYKNLRDESNRVISLLVKRGDQRRDYGQGPRFYKDILRLCGELKGKLLEDLQNAGKTEPQDKKAKDADGDAAMAEKKDAAADAANAKQDEKKDSDDKEKDDAQEQKKPHVVHAFGLTV